MAERRGAWLMVAVGLFASAIAVAQDDLRSMSEAALKEETAAFDEINARFEKNKLKPAESALLFGKKKLTKEQQRERMAEIGTQVAAGEASFRIISVDVDQMKVGNSGVIAPQFQPIWCEDTDELSNGFYGKFRLRGMEAASRDFLFRNVPDAEDMVKGKRITVSVPVIITGRESGTFVFESLASVVKRVRAAESKKKKK